MNADPLENEYMNTNCQVMDTVRLRVLFEKTMYVRHLNL